LAAKHLAIFDALRPGLAQIQRFRAAVVGLAAGALLPVLVGAIWLRSRGLAIHEIGRTALLQPRWWRSWYPRSLRRPGDVWTRLPRPVRQFRACLGVAQAFSGAVFLPLYAGLLLSGHPEGAWSWILVPPMFLVTALMFVTRHRATKYVSAATGLSAWDASRLVSTPTWRASAWRRGPAASLLRPHPAPLPRFHDTDDSNPTATLSASR
jgi:hypothetical protein